MEKYEPLVRHILTLYALRVISVKFHLVISMLYKTGVVMRIKDMIIQDESNWYFNKFIPLLLLKTYTDNK